MGLSPTHSRNAEFGWRSVNTAQKQKETRMNPFLISAEVNATAVVITQDDPRHPDYTPKDKEENK